MQIYKKIMNEYCIENHSEKWTHSDTKKAEKDFFADIEKASGDVMPLIV